MLAKRFNPAYDGTVRLFTLDVNSDPLPDIESDYIIHAASHTSPVDYALKPVETIYTNIIGTDRLIRQYIHKKEQRFLFCSSVEVYGQNKGDTETFTETYSGYVDSNTLRAGYPSAKRAAEALCNAYATENANFSFFIARIGRIYGPTVIEGDAKAPTQFIYNAVHGEDIVLKSNGMQEYSYGYVGDCAIAILTILLRGTSREAYNIADVKSQCKLHEFAEIAAHSGGTRVVFNMPDMTESVGYSKVTKALMDTKKLEALGWKAKTHLSEGISKTIAYIKALKEGIDA